MALFSPRPLTDSGELAASTPGLFLFPCKETRQRVMGGGGHILEPCLDRCLQKQVSKWSAHYRSDGTAPGSNTRCKIWWMREEQQIGLTPGLRPASGDQNVTRDHLTTMRCRKHALSLTSMMHVQTCPHTKKRRAHTERWTRCKSKVCWR